MSDSLRLHGLQHARLPCPSPTPRVDSNSCPLSRWCRPTISSSVVPLSSLLQYFPASGSFQRVFSSTTVQKHQFFSASPQIKSVTVSTVSPSICHEVMGHFAWFWIWCLSYYWRSSIYSDNKSFIKCVIFKYFILSYSLSLLSKWYLLKNRSFYDFKIWWFIILFLL